MPQFHPTHVVGQKPESAIGCFAVLGWAGGICLACLEMQPLGLTQEVGLLLPSTQYDLNGQGKAWLWWTCILWLNTAFSFQKTQRGFVTPLPVSLLCSDIGRSWALLL